MLNFTVIDGGAITAIDAAVVVLGIAIATPGPTTGANPGEDGGVPCLT